MAVLCLSNEQLEVEIRRINYVEEKETDEEEAEEDNEEEEEK